MKIETLEKIFTQKKTTLSFDEAVAKSLLFLGGLRTTEEDLVDYWFGIADNWDLNIWLDVDDKDYKDEDEEKYLRATLYLVKNGQITQEFYRIYPLTN